MSSLYPEVRSVAELEQHPEEYRSAVAKLVVSHTVNELHGARVFDEPAIRMAPTPRSKWLACRIAMEEYHHHVRFEALAREMKIPAAASDPNLKRPLTIFDFELSSWPEFCVIKMLADLAELLQVEDLAFCSFVPLRDLARSTMPEERFHAEFGRESCAELCRNPEGKIAVERAIAAYFGYLPGFFGASGSKNNAIYRRYGLKKRTNEEMRADFLDRTTRVIESIGLQVPAH
jgi:ring-1,2-phenylacetyl-CoA epoxidase subunit PaaA